MTARSEQKPKPDQLEVRYPPVRPNYGAVAKNGLGMEKEAVDQKHRNSCADRYEPFTKSNVVIPVPEQVQKHRAPYQAMPKSHEAKVISIAGNPKNVEPSKLGPTVSFGLFSAFNRIRKFILRQWRGLFSTSQS